MLKQIIKENIGLITFQIIRTQGGDFSFPYPQSGREVERNKQKVKDLFWNSKFDKQIYPLSWLIEKFMPVKDWSENKIKELNAIHEVK